MAEALVPPNFAPKDAVKATLDTLDPSHSSQATKKLENTEKRDTLIEYEKQVQQKWQDQHVFEPDAPSIDELPFSATPQELHSAHPKFFGNFAYPYMNGTLHAGHSFTVSKIEFTAGYHRMKGERVLFPLGYHW